MSKNIEPLNVANFGIAVHEFTVHHAEVSPSLEKKDLENKDYWVHVSKRLTPGDEIRCIASDGSFLARLYVSFVNGYDVNVKCYEFNQLDVVDMEEDSEYNIKRGPGRAGWYVQSKATGDIIIEKQATQSEAYKQLEQYRQTIN